MRNQFNVHFWGVRGSIPCPGSETVRYGGNTPCVEMQVGTKRLIFDGGTGIRVLGLHLLRHAPIEADMFFTHTHWDHIHGFPFFAPAFQKGNRLGIYGPAAADGSSVEERLTLQMRHPNFPIPLREMGAQLTFHEIVSGESTRIDDVTVDSAALNHPAGATGYRVNWQQYAAAYVTDTEHFPDRLDENVVGLARNADILIYDAMYTDEEYHAQGASKVGWGHSTWQEAVKVAHAANVKKLVLFHHDPLHGDLFLDDVGEAVAQEFPNSYVAREGLTLQLVVT